MPSEELQDMSYSELKERLLTVEPLRDRALLCLTYAVLGRVGEVVQAKYNPDNTPIMKSQVHDIGTHIAIKVKTEKRRTWRRVPVNKEREAWLVEPILAYAQLLPQDYTPLFPYSTRWAQKIFLKHFGTENIHLLRHWRTTHLLNGSVTGKSVPIHIVQKMGGWSDSTTIERTYDHTIIEDYLDVI